jgi:hypothetical protein
MTMTFSARLYTFTPDGGAEIVAVSDRLFPSPKDLVWVWVGDSISCRIDGFHLRSLPLDGLKVPYTPETLTAHLTQFYSERENYNALLRRVREHLTELDLALPF